MADSPIYSKVRDKLITHGVDRTPDGLRTLNDKKLFLLFVELERAREDKSFEKVLRAVNAIDSYLAAVGKRHVVVFAYMYLHFSELTPRTHELDQELPDGRVRKAQIFDHRISDEARLIGLWAQVKYHQLGDHFLRLVYSSDCASLNGE